MSTKKSTTKKPTTKKPVTKKPTTKKTITKKPATKKAVTKKPTIKKTTTKKPTIKKTTTKKPTTKKTTTKKAVTKKTTTKKPTTKKPTIKKTTTKKPTTKKITTKKPVKKTKLGGLISEMYGKSGLSRLTNMKNGTGLSTVQSWLNTTDKKKLCTNLNNIQVLSQNDKLKLSDINKIHEHCRNKILENFGNPLLMTSQMKDCPNIGMLFAFFIRRNTYQEKQKELGFLSKYNVSRGKNKFKAKTEWGPSAQAIGIGQATGKIASFIPI